METIKLAGSFQAPTVTLDAKAGIFELKGICFLTNAYEFFFPILAWLDEYEKHPNPVSVFVFDFTYVNTASQKMLFEILKKLNRMKEDGKNISIEWFFEENDDDLKSLGDDLLSLTKVPYKTISKAVDE